MSVLAYRDPFYQTASHVDVITQSSGMDVRIQAALGEGYAVGRELGGGGMSRVFLARDLRLDRDVVVKLLAPEVAETISADRFERELRIAARLQHPNIVPVLIAGQADGLPYYTMPFVRGESLRARLNAAPMSTRAAVRVIGDIAHALAYAHGEGVIHRDIKPENVLMAGEIAVVTDFGIGKAIHVARPRQPSSALTQAGMAVGTPAYMAPEQAAGDPNVDPRADLYAWALVAYECLTGVHPFGKRSMQGYVRAHMLEQPAPVSERNPDVSHTIATLIMRCLEKDPDQRPGSALELVDAVQLASVASVPAATHLSEADREAAPDGDTSSIAVLPFVNLSADAENEYFSDGITEEIRNLLAQDRTLRVAARSSSFAYKGKSVDTRVIAEQLQVRTILEGSIRRSGNTVRITAQLVHAQDRYQLWSNRFDRELTDIFAVQDEIATAIATTLRPVLRESADVSPFSSDTTRREVPAGVSRARHAVVPDAYDEVLKGRYLNHRRRNGDGDVREAIDHFRRALEIDPAFAPALAGLAESYLWLCILFVLPPTEAFAHARRYARDALAADPDLTSAHYVLGEIAFWHEWDVRECERHLRRALALDPSNPEALLLSARLHLVRGERREMHEVMEAAVRADPIGLGTRWYYMVLLYLAGALDRVVAAADRLLTEVPDFIDARRWRGKAHCLLGDYQRGLDDLQRATEAAPPHAWLLAELSLALSANGRRDEAAAIRSDLIERSERSWIPPTAIVLSELALNDRDGALRWCERALQTRDFLCVVFPFEGMFGFRLPGQGSTIADDRRWIDLQRRVGMCTFDA
jgi:serine/threonine-protein kinase